MASTAQSAQRKYSLGSVKPWVQNAADFLGNMFGFSNIGGYRAHGSVPNSDHPKGLALDFMTMKAAQANALIDYVLSHQKELAIKYVIYNRRIYDHGVWKPYHGPNPHTDHVHISFNDTAPSGDLTSTGGSIVNAGFSSAIPGYKELSALASTLQSADFWKRVGLYGLGFMLIVIGAALFVTSETPVVKDVV